MTSVDVRVVPAPRKPVADFAAWVASACGPRARVLEVGAGDSHSGGLRPLLARRPHLVAVDPDPAVLENPWPDERVLADVQSFAARGPEPFDVAFAVYVLEHVADPEGFVDACALPAGTRWWASAWSRAAYSLGRPALMGHLSVRMVR